MLIHWSWDKIPVTPCQGYRVSIEAVHIKTSESKKDPKCLVWFRNHLHTALVANPAKKHRNHLFNKLGPWLLSRQSLPGKHISGKTLTLVPTGPHDIESWLKKIYYWNHRLLQGIPCWPSLNHCHVNMNWFLNFPLSQVQKKNRAQPPSPHFSRRKRACSWACPRPNGTNSIATRCFNWWDLEASSPKYQRNG